jgi:hypothetical protein
MNNDINNNINNNINKDINNDMNNEINNDINNDINNNMNNNMNNDINKVYNRFKGILSGCSTCLDAFYFSEKFIKAYPDYKDLIYSMIQSKKFGNVIDLRTLKSSILKLNEFEFREDADDYLNKFAKNSLDTIQMVTINKVILNKKNKITDEEKIGTYKFNPEYKKEFDTLLMTKNCPHCDKECTINEKTDYIICGYQDTKSGFDWFGCGKDWCFECGKMLCKSWSGNDLCSEYNRLHDSKCCKEHALQNKCNYHDDYCQCMTKYVRR